MTQVEEHAGHYLRSTERRDRAFLTCTERAARVAEEGQKLLKQYAEVYCVIKRPCKCRAKGTPSLSRPARLPQTPIARVSRRYPAIPVNLALIPEFDTPPKNQTKKSRRCFPLLITHIA